MHGSPMSDDQRILLFRPRGSPRQGGRGGHRTLEHPTPPEGLAKYEAGAADDNYRHRMMVNLAALVFTVLLGVVGGWLALQIAEMRKNQDCVLSGRRNCTPIDIKLLER
jgi:hypothetical protein